jgi:hypothetical protein
MRSHSSTRLLSREGRAASPLQARCAVAGIALLTSAVAYTAPLPSPPQQLTVAFTNAFPNGSVDSLTMPNPNSAAITATNPLFTGGTPQNLYTALTWVTNPVTSTLDLIYADAEQHKIWRLSGPGYQTPTPIFSWSGKGSGPPYPMGLAADTAGNVYVISPSSAWGTPGVWVLPIIPSGNANAGTYGAPLLIDDTFNDLLTGKPVTTLALAEVLVAGTAATPVGGAPPAWNPLDLLVLVGDTFNTRVIRYSQAQIQNVIAAQSSLRGPTSTVVTQAQFSTQAILKIPPVAVGMDVARDPNTQDVTLLFSTAGGRILNFDSGKNAFITPYAINLGIGLTRLKVGTFQGSQYVFVGQLPGKILEFAAPAPGASDTKPFASVSKGVSAPTDLAVTNSGSTPVTGFTPAGSCINNASGCPILPQLSLDITGPGTAKIPQNASITVDSCAIAADPRVTNNGEGWSCAPETLDLGSYCSNMPQVVLPSNICGKSGPSGAGFNVAKITARAVNLNINNTLTTFIVSPSTTLPANSNPACGDPNGPIVAWGPLPGIESNIPEGNTLIDVTVACVPDPPPAGKGSHPSVIVEGAALVSLTPAYVGGEFANLQTVFTQLTGAGQISDNTNTVVPTIQSYITQSQTYFAAGSYSCALNTLWNGAQYVNGLVNSPATSGDFIAGTPPGADQNPSGTLLMRFDHLYYDVNILAGNAPITTDALNLPAASVPACAGTAGNVLFDNTGGNTSISVGYRVFGQEDANDNYSYGFLFTPTTSGNLASISAPMGSLSGSSGNVTLSIYTNNAGAPGTLLDTLTATVGAFNTSVVSPLTTFVSTNNPSLSTAQSYWVVASSPAPAGALGAEIGWNNSNVAQTNSYFTDNGTPITGPCCGPEAALTLTSNPWVGSWAGPIASTCGSYSGPSSDVITVSGPGQLNFAESTNIGAYDFTFTYSGNTATSTTYGGTDSCTLNGNTISCSYPPACQTVTLTRQVLQ